MLKRAGCAADHTRRLRSPHRSRGRVLRQSVRPGRIVPAGTPVGLVVGSRRASK
jgi:multidrug resistance efflux pump